MLLSQRLGSDRCSRPWPKEVQSFRFGGPVLSPPNRAKPKSALTICASAECPMATSAAMTRHMMQEMRAKVKGKNDDNFNSQEKTSSPRVVHGSCRPILGLKRFAIGGGFGVRSNMEIGSDGIDVATVVMTSTA